MTWGPLGELARNDPFVSYTLSTSEGEVRGALASRHKLGRTQTNHLSLSPALKQPDFTTPCNHHVRIRFFSLVTSIPVFIAETPAEPTCLGSLYLIAVQS